MIKHIIKKILGPEKTMAVKSMMIKNWKVKNKALDSFQTYQDKNRKPLRLVGFVKCFNEGSNGNLERCLKHLTSFCDDIVVCDDSSTDNSLEIAQKFTNNIIKLPDEFTKELEHKQKLLELALSLDPDWIVFLDPDEIFDRFGESNGIRSLCYYGQEKNIDGFAFQEFNLWKDFFHYRTDELWFQNWQVRLWKNTGNLKFEIKEGLHNRLWPLGINTISRSEIKVIHFGFVSKDEINKKISTYQSLGQKGRSLERIKDEAGIKLKPFSQDWFPLSIQKK